MNNKGIVQLAAGVALLGGLAFADGARAEPLKIGYSVRLIGLSLGTAGLVANIDPKSYQLEVSAKLSGVAAAVTRSESAAQSSGALAGDRVLPAAYATTTTNSKETRTVRMALNAGTVRAVEIAPPFDSWPDRVPVTDSHKRNIVDPLSALLMPAAGDGLGPAACDRSLPIYDGFTRFDVTLSYVGQRQVSTRGYKGPVAVCAARYKPVSGHRPDRAATKFMADNRNMEVWLMPVEGGRLLAPYKISVGTMVGTVVIEASNVSMGAPGVDRASR
jgi:hypothetical protein